MAYYSFCLDTYYIKYRYSINNILKLKIISFAINILHHQQKRMTLSITYFMTCNEVIYSSGT